jgi:hypothetical protein
MHYIETPPSPVPNWNAQDEKKPLYRKGNFCNKITALDTEGIIYYLAGRKKRLADWKCSTFTPKQQTERVGSVSEACGTTLSRVQACIVTHYAAIAQHGRLSLSLQYPEISAIHTPPPQKKNPKNFPKFSYY